MNKDIEINKDVKAKFELYPAHVKPYIESLRTLVFLVAEELEISPIKEELKWGEPSYSVESGSPIRLDWKLKTPNNYYLYFHCQTKLVDTFREIYGDVLTFQGNRAIVLDITGSLPEQQIRHCIELALTYQKVKHLPLLGA